MALPFAYGNGKPPVMCLTTVAAGIRGRILPDCRRRTLRKVDLKGLIQT